MFWGQKAQVKEFVNHHMCTQLVFNSVFDGCQKASAWTGGVAPVVWCLPNKCQEFKPQHDQKKKKHCLISEFINYIYTCYNFFSIFIST
jgi:hypothetical protein